MAHVIANETANTVLLNSVSSSNVHQGKSYASAVQKESYPTKDQAIVIDSIEGSSLEDYILATAKVINPNEIRFASKISKNRVCVFLANKDIVNRLAEKKTYITINTTTLEIRPLLSKSRRIILSNVCPVIPNYVLLSTFNNLNIRLNSTITHLRAGFSAAGLSYILSFRRQVYIHSDDIYKIPESVKIYHEDTEYRIYFSSDNMICFLCKKQGHLARNCQEHSTDTAIIHPTVNVLEDKNQTETPVVINDNMYPPSSTTITPTKYRNPSNSLQSNTQKHPLSSSTISSDNVTDYNSTTSDNTATRIPLFWPEEFNKEPKPLFKKSTQSTLKKKKIETDSESEEVDELLLSSSYSPSIENPYNNSILSYLQLKSFLEKTKNNYNILEVASEYTPDAMSILNLLTEKYILLKNKKIKNRFTRTIKKLRLAMDTHEQTDVDSSMNQSNTDE